MKKANGKKIIIKDGEINFIYNDTMKDLMDHGKSEIKRVSHVEPINIDDSTVMWEADMSPVGGPKLGPFPTRQEALDKEVEWLNSHSLGV